MATKKTKSSKRGRPVVWRHNMSGVWIGWLTESPVPGHLRLDGRRLRYWRGGRVDCSEVAEKGAQNGDTITTRVITDIAVEGSVEITTTTDEIVEHAMSI